MYKVQQKKIALERIKGLFSFASQSFNLNPIRSHRYIQLAKKISTKFKVKIPKPLRRRMCKNCFHYLQAGSNATIRYNKSRIIITCKDCNNIMRIPAYNIH